MCLVIVLYDYNILFFFLEAVVVKCSGRVRGWSRVVFILYSSKEVWFYSTVSFEVFFSYIYSSIRSCLGFNEVGSR